MYGKKVMKHRLNWKEHVGGMSDGKEGLKLAYTGCPGRNVPDFGMMFLKLKYTDITKKPIS
jgi:hypothetical protein